MALNLTALTGSCDLTLHKLGVRLDGADNHYQYVIDLTLPITSRGMAEEMGDTLPGLPEILDCAVDDDNWKGSSVAKPGIDVKATLFAKAAPVGEAQGPVSAGDVIIQGSARVVQVKADLSKRQQRATVRLQMGGQGFIVSAPLTASLGRVVTFSFERKSAQETLRFTDRAKRPAMSVGMVATVGGDYEVVGRVVEIDGDAVTLCEEGKDYVVHADNIVSAFSFGDDVNTAEALGEYEKRCVRRKYAVSWGVLADVLAASEDGPWSKGIMVTLDHVEKAIEALDALANDGGDGNVAQDDKKPDAEPEPDTSTTAQADTTLDTSTAQDAAPVEPQERDNVVSFKPEGKTRKPRGKALASA